VTHTLLSFVMAAAQAAAQAPPVPAVHITPAEIAAVLETAIAKSAVDQPIKAVDVHGGRTLVAMLHRDRAEAGALIHERVTETYYILHGSGTMVTGPSLSGTRQGGESRKVGPGDVIIVPAGTPHSFDQLDSPISYLVFRFDPGK